MPRRKPKLHARPGRPPFDKVAIYVYVEAGRRRFGISAHAFCMQDRLRILSHGNKPNEGDYEILHRRHELGGTTLYRRFMEAKREIVPRIDLPEGIPSATGWPGALPDELEVMINELASAA